MAPGQMDVSELLSGVREGERTAVEHLVTLLYADLHRLAAAQMSRERRGHTWQPTVLVNELCIILLKNPRLNLRRNPDLQDREAFLALAGRIMKHMLISHARLGWNRARRLGVEQADEVEGESGDWNDVEGTLSKLESIDPVLRTVVELRVFEGLTIVETAERLGCAPRSVVRHWEFARHWLQQAFRSP